MGTTPFYNHRGSVEAPISGQAVPGTRGADERSAHWQGRPFAMERRISRQESVTSAVATRGAFFPQCFQRHLDLRFRVVVREPQAQNAVGQIEAELVGAGESVVVARPGLGRAARQSCGEAVAGPVCACEGNGGNPVIRAVRCGDALDRDAGYGLQPIDQMAGEGMLVFA